MSYAVSYGHSPELNRKSPSICHCCFPAFMPVFCDNAAAAKIITCKAANAPQVLIVLAHPHISRAVVTLPFEKLQEQREPPATTTIDLRSSYSSLPISRNACRLATIHCPQSARHGYQSPNRHQARKLAICAIQTCLVRYVPSSTCIRWICS